MNILVYDGIDSVTEHRKKNCTNMVATFTFQLRAQNNAIQLRAAINIATSIQVFLRRCKIRTRGFCCNYDNWRAIFNVIRSLYVLRYKYILY